MTEQDPAASPSPRSRVLRPADLWLGFLALGLGNLIVSFIQPVFPPWSGVLYAVAVAAVVGVVYLVLERRGLAVGLAGGFVVLTVASGGACTMFTELEGTGVLIGMSVYFLGVLIGGVALLVHAGLRRRGRLRRRPSPQPANAVTRKEEGQRPRPSPGRRPLRLGEVWLGLLVFGVANYLVMFLTLFEIYWLMLMPPLLGILYGLAIALLAAVAYFALGWRGFAVGLAAGFVLMTLISGGACTLLVDFDEFEDGGAEAGMTLYPLVVVASGAVLAIHALVQVARKRRR